MVEGEFLPHHGHTTIPGTFPISRVPLAELPTASGPAVVGDRRIVTRQAQNFGACALSIPYVCASG